MSRLARGVEGVEEYRTALRSLTAESNDMESVLQEIDPGLRTQVIAARFETVAAVHRNLAEGATKIAGILGGAKRG